MGGGIFDARGKISYQQARFVCPFNITPKLVFFLHDMMTHSQYNRCNIFVIIKRTEEQLMVALFENFNYSLRICYSKD